MMTGSAEDLTPWVRRELAALVKSGVREPKQLAQKLGVHQWKIEAFLKTHNRDVS
jgi:hypothetical protein